MKQILIIREFDDFSRIIAENGLGFINLPTIKTALVEDLSDFEANLADIENYDGIFLTSHRATGIFLAKLSELKKDFRGKVYVLGKRSFDVLKTENCNLVFDETNNTAREMLEKIAPEDLSDKRFLFVRGEKSLRVVPDFLKKIATVDEAFVYRTEKIAVEIDKLKEIREKLKNGEICCVCFFSPSAAESFIEQFGAESLHQTLIATIGKTTAEFFGRQNLKVDFVAERATAEDFAVGLIEYFRKVS